jgi:L-asparaginase
MKQPNPSDTAVRVIATGGTFDKHYDPATGVLGFEKTSGLPALLAQARLDPAAAFETVMLIDSLDMTDEHRGQIALACRRSPERRIAIIHGTDTMIETAAVLARESTDATIVLTGAMVPAVVAGSDALFNLGFALACARLLPAGIHIAAHGRIFDWRTVRKNRAAARFEAI